MKSFIDGQTRRVLEITFLDYEGVRGGFEDL
jgi:hypothetical protein